jgi:uncharacterized C2H2 Zn-finger protein
MSTWRYRRCPSCGASFPGGQLRLLRYGSHWRQRGYSLRRCPRCGHVGQTRDFGIVGQGHRDTVKTGR